MKKFTSIYLVLFLGLIISVNSFGNTLSTKHLIFVDNTLQDVEYLMESIDLPSSKIIMLNPKNYEGIIKLNEELKKYENIQSIHIVGHGNPAELFIGKNSFYGDDIFANHSSFQKWKSSVSEDADLILYGCSIAGSVQGKEFVDNLSVLTGMDVAASTNLTGHVSSGGDWNLEYTAGNVETAIAFSSDIADYKFTLQGLNYADLNNYEEIDEGNSGGSWIYPDGSGRTAYQSENTTQPVYLLSKETGVINKVFKGTIKVDLNQTDNDDIGFVFGYQNFSNTYIWSWDNFGIRWGGARPDGGHILFYKNTQVSTFDPPLPGNKIALTGGINERWTSGRLYQFEILYTSDRIRIKVDGEDKFDISAADAGVTQFLAGRFGFYNYSQGNVTFGNVQTANASDEQVPPTAQDDSYGMSPNTTLTVDRFEGILKNDYDANLDDFTIVLVSDVNHGTLNLDLNDGSFNYTPTANYQGSDEFTYKLVQDDTQEESAVRTVTFGIIAANQAPTDISLSNNEVGEGAPLNAVIGEFSTTDPNNPEDEHDYVLTNNDGGNFILSGNKLLVNNSSLPAGTRSIEVSSTDLFGESYTKSFTISVLSNNTPSSANSSIFTRENTDYTFSESDFTFTDSDSEDTFGGIRIETIETAGDLEYNGSGVFNESIIDDVSNLVFRSPLGASGDPYSTFTFKIFDSKGGISDAAYTMNIIINLPELTTDDATDVASTTASISGDLGGFVITRTQYQSIESFMPRKAPVLRDEEFSVKRIERRWPISTLELFDPRLGSVLLNIVAFAPLKTNDGADVSAMPLLFLKLKIRNMGESKIDDLEVDWRPDAPLGESWHARGWQDGRIGGGVALEAGESVERWIVIGHHDPERFCDQNYSNAKSLVEHGMAHGEAWLKTTRELESKLPMSGDPDLDLALRWNATAAVCLTKCTAQGQVVTLGYRELNQRDSFWTSFIHLLLWPELDAKMIEQSIEAQKANGKIPTCILPEIEREVDIDINAYFVLRAIRHLNHTGNKALAKKWWKPMVLALTFLEELDDENIGVPIQRTYWGDWKDVPGVKDRLYSPHAVMVVAAARRELGKVADWLGDSSTAKKWNDASQQATSFLEKNFHEGGMWNGSFYQQRWNDGRDDGCYLQDQVVGGLYGVVDASRFQKVLESGINRALGPFGISETWPHFPKEFGYEPGHYHNGGVWPWLNYVDAWSRLAHNRKEEGVELLKRVAWADLFNREDEQPHEYVDWHQGENHGPPFQGWTASFIGAVAWGIKGHSLESDFEKFS